MQEFNSAPPSASTQASLRIRFQLMPLISTWLHQLILGSSTPTNCRRCSTAHQLKICRCSKILWWTSNKTTSTHRLAHSLLTLSRSCQCVRIASHSSSQKEGGTATSAWTTTSRDVSHVTDVSKVWATSSRRRSRRHSASSHLVDGSAVSAAIITSREGGHVTDVRRLRLLRIWMECQSTFSNWTKKLTLKPKLRNRSNRLSRWSTSSTKLRWETQRQALKVVKWRDRTQVRTCPN